MDCQGNDFEHRQVVGRGLLKEKARAQKQDHQQQQVQTGGGDDTFFLERVHRSINGPALGPWPWQW